MTDIVLYSSSAVIAIIGLTYAAVPLYRLFCQKTGLGGTTQTALTTPQQQADIAARAARLRPDANSRKLRITFNADVSTSMRWQFRPQQSQVYVKPGESSLIFYTATNPTEHDIIGISTYNVVPFKAGQYFNKIQCFCFEEQKLKAGEQVDMPVFFFIDPAFNDDPEMDDVKEITLSYTFFQAKHNGINGLLKDAAFTSIGNGNVTTAPVSS
jgi:cytochrome c oxidase assembly protein subunit 11